MLVVPKYHPAGGDASPGCGRKMTTVAAPRVARTPSDARAWRRADNPQVKSMYRPPARHDPSATADREMMGQTGRTPGLGGSAVVFESAASIVFGQAGSACAQHQRPSSSQQSAGS